MSLMFFQKPFVVRRWCESRVRQPSPAWTSRFRCAFGLGRKCPGSQCLLSHPYESTVHRTCLTRAVSSCTRLYTVRSARIMLVILVFACRTVVWSRSPKCLPILGSDESVSSRDRYIATCRG